MTERRRVSRPLLAGILAAAAAMGVAYAYGPGARAEQVEQAAAAARTQLSARAGDARAVARPATPRSPAAGSGATMAEPASTASCTTSARYAKRQLRGIWIATVHNLDWPSRAGLTPAQQRAEYVKLLDLAAKRRFNAVFLQVRPASDALYSSSLEPWSQYLTGTAGKNPGWDPLPFLIQEAHKRGMEFHAWFNPYRAGDTTDLSKLPANHPARLHPNWVVKHEGKLYYNPGLPQVRDWVTKVVKDVTRRYDVDGIHFDDYFYPYPGQGTQFADSAAFKTYGKGMKLADWRRDNVNKLIAQVSKAVHTEKPYVKFGVSPFGIWRNKSEVSSGSNTKGMSAYSSIYADAKAWIKARSVDYLIPQIYWPRGYAIADYNVLVPWWANAVKGTGVDLYIGQALYQVGTKTIPAWAKPDELPSHLAVNQKYPEVKGDVFFNASQLRTNPLSVMDRLVKEYYTRPALLPLIKGMSTKAPAAPSGLKHNGRTLAWAAQSGARSYGIYRVDSAGTCATADGRNLIAVVPATHAPSYAGKVAGTYYVTTLDRLGNESLPTRLAIR
ncbi:glycoside hydrolase family 10 protein [Planotetraspora mira]|uniref:Glycosyl hydrolase n=1 Tax=Planotetraspora mira TaxID=58121 RepID=A0A8J3U7I5_9ACTN|nr:family 10 glycosylhydrolase [Planotetraspora mira]GII34035.1 glycosyl hydrolase [Planotetraspora mira]